MTRPLLALMALVGVLVATPAAAQPTCNPLDPLPATILRDAYGVPHVFATDEDDLAFVNGYVQAEDRLFEMEVLRRAGRGTLSEVLGAALLEMDITIRRDLYTEAERQAQFDALPAADQQTLVKFAEGVNRYICEAELDATKKPSEYTALGFDPAEWSVLDSVAAADFLVGVFGVFGGDEVRNAAFYFNVLGRLGRAKAKRVFDDHFPRLDRRRASRDPQAPTTIPAAEQIYDDPLRRSTRPFSRKQLKFLEQFIPSINRAAGIVEAEAQLVAEAERALGLRAARNGLASNAIVVSGSLTDTGDPILLGGPQVGYAIPSFFFEVGLHGPETDAVGVLPPAGPSIVIGRTENFAYTITSGISDQVDTYVEVLNPADPREYLFDGAFVSMDCRIETFTVQEPPPPTGPGGAPTEEQREFCRTVHGPVFHIDEEGGAAFSKRASNRDLELSSAANWLRMARAKTLAEFKALVDGIDVSFNYFFADNLGNIAYFHAGRRPLRPARTDPRFPLPGTGEFEWEGTLPKGALPGVVNPAQGWMANWNNKPVAGWSSGDIRELWGLEHRVQALHDGILDELDADGTLSVDDVNLVMYQGAKKDAYAGGRQAYDTRSAVPGPYLALEVAVDALPSSTPDKATLIAGRDLIEAWIEAETVVPMTAVKTGAPINRTVRGAPLIDLDGDGFYELPGAALYERWREILQQRVFGDELGVFVDQLSYEPAPGANTGDHGGGDTQDSVLVHAIMRRGPNGRRTVRYFDDVTTSRPRETRDFQLVESLREAMAELADCTTPTPSTCRHANHVNVFTSLGAAPNVTIGETRGGVNRGSYNQIVELAPTLFSVNVQPPGQSGHVDAVLLAQILGAPDEATQRQIMDDAHLTDQLELYERFEYKPMPFTQVEVMAAQ